MNSKHLNLIRQYDSADKEEFKRPDHPDFMTSVELGKMGFNGIRVNTIGRQLEFWLNGLVAFYATEAELAVNERAFLEKYKNFFGFEFAEELSNYHSAN